MQNNLLVNWTRQQRCSSRTKQISGSSVLNDLSQLIKNGVMLFLLTICRHDLRQIVIGLLAEKMIYEMECCCEFSPRFNLTPRCFVWDLAEIKK